VHEIKGLSVILIFTCLSMACSLGAGPGSENGPSESPSAAFPTEEERSVGSPSPSDTAISKKPSQAATTDTPARTPVPGIDVPIVVRGISVRIEKAEFVTSWEGHSPDPGMSFLVAYVRIVSGAVSMSDFARWKMYLSDPDGTIYPQTGALVHTDDSPSQASNGEWVFSVKDGGSRFVLHFPEEATVPLDPLLPG
jgi:hypothetical protein